MILGNTNDIASGHRRHAAAVNVNGRSAVGHDLTAVERHERILGCFRRYLQTVMVPPEGTTDKGQMVRALADRYADRGQVNATVVKAAPAAAIGRVVKLKSRTRIEAEQIDCVQRIVLAEAECRRTGLTVVPDLNVLQRRYVPRARNIQARLPRLHDQNILEHAATGVAVGRLNTDPGRMNTKAAQMAADPRDLDGLRRFTHIRRGALHVNVQAAQRAGANVKQRLLQIVVIDGRQVGGIRRPGAALITVHRHAVELECLGHKIRTRRNVNRKPVLFRRLDCLFKSNRIVRLTVTVGTVILNVVIYNGTRLGVAEVYAQEAGDRLCRRRLALADNADLVADLRNDMVRLRGHHFLCLRGFITVGVADQNFRRSRVDRASRIQPVGRQRGNGARRRFCNVANKRSRILYRLARIFGANNGIFSNIKKQIAHRKHLRIPLTHLILGRRSVRIRTLAITGKQRGGEHQNCCQDTKESFHFVFLLSSISCCRSPWCPQSLR